jgi:HlyD family secretion protein
MRAWSKQQSTVKKVVFSVVIVVVGVLIVIKGQGTGNTAIETVKRQNLVRSISASGSVVSSTDLSLGFEQSKMVSSIKVSVGTKVKKGDILANLSNGNERAALTSAKGALLAARARYNKVLEGSSSQEISLAQVQLESTKKTQENLVANARRKLYSDGLIADPQDTTQDVAPSISGNYSGNEEGEYRISFTNNNSNQIRYNGLEKGTVDIDTLPKPLGTKGLLIAFMGTTYNVNSSWRILLPNKSGPNYTVNLNSYQAAVASAEAAIAEKQAELDLKKASARQPDVDAALADMITAQAGVDMANATLEKTMLRAPADGTITSVNVKVGEIPQIGKIAISLQDVSNLYLEANINESNIKSVAIGQPVTVTFDAFTGDTYHATVSSIDPAATIENNVVNYKIKALLTETESIRPGMTANMIIQTAEISQALVLPGRVIETKNGVQTVLRITDDRRNKTTSQVITTGLKGDGDLVEITTGLGEGDRILWTVPSTK